MLYAAHRTRPLLQSSLESILVEVTRGMRCGHERCGMPGLLDLSIACPRRYLRLAGDSVSNTSIAPFPDQPETAVIAVGVAGLSTFLTFGYSIVNTAPGGQSKSTLS
jgi:hypothetical protein